MYNSQEVAEKIKQTAKLKKISISKMLLDCELNKNTLFTMQSNGYLPRTETLGKIADYLEVSVDYLLGRTQESTKIISGNQIKTGNITGDNNANMNMDTNKTSKYDKTTLQVADVFQDLDVLDKAKVLNLIAELSNKEGA